ncbi:hypothetical protein DPMN_072573 [Dreissena polymorpha]|uniref:Ig-like domain-containing protein n=1 Tax=Dreissena polymorpha TaxID=45954 RepID=A0A9D4BQK8_DREPO|nr:hypothetical protein DPMN_072573 [Dreissena polymorpha]
MGFTEAIYLTLTICLTQALLSWAGLGVVVTKTVGENIEIRCTPPNDTTYFFVRAITNKTLTIAECVSNKCFLKDDTLKTLYEIKHTDDGAVLKLLTIDQNTYGMYQCCETYKPDICGSTIVSEQDISSQKDDDMKTETQLEQVNLVKTSVSKQEGVVQIQCTSSLDVTFEFVNDVVKIAECMPTRRQCIIFDNPYDESYSISYRKHGGILAINHANKDAYGTYRCFSTRNTSNAQSVTIGPQDAAIEHTTNSFNVVVKEGVNLRGQLPISDNSMKSILGLSITIFLFTLFLVLQKILRYIRNQRK